MNNNILKKAADSALPSFTVKTKYPELEAMITSFLHGSFAPVSDGDSDIIIEDTDGGIALSSKAIPDGIILERPFTEDAIKDAAILVLGDKGSVSFSADEENRLVILGEASVRLTPTEFRLFSAILKNGGGFISAEQLSEEVWGRCDRNLCTVYISYLRRKLDGVFGDGTLITASGKGYRLRGNFDRSN